MTLTLRPHQERALDAMFRENKGQIVVPTGGGKTMIMIKDLLLNLELAEDLGHQLVNVVVAPRILLAQQLCDDFFTFLPDNVKVLHVHSGRTPFDSSTKPEEIKEFVDNNDDAHILIFTTYHLSLIHI